MKIKVTFKDGRANISTITPEGTDKEALMAEKEKLFARLAEIEKLLARMAEIEALLAE